jgi:hypothetical protein
MKISVTDEKKTVEDQHRQLEEQIADFQKRKIEYLNKDKDKGYHTLTLGKFGKSKKWLNPPEWFWKCQIQLLLLTMAIPVVEFSKLEMFLAKNQL